MAEDLLRTPLYDAHVAAKARMVPFAGYSMPVSYSGVVDEHQTVRQAVGLFDVSHMGEVEFTGPRALEVVNRIITNDLEAITDGQALYTAMCRDDGGIVDDLVVYRFSPERILICVNASNRAKDFAFMRALAGDDCEVQDRSDDYAQIAVQGPEAAALLGALTAADLSAIGTYYFTTGQVAGAEAIISRTGYTGEDGFELYVAPADAMAVWGALMEAGAKHGVKPAGLGARDSLRLEMKYALYGNDIDETTNPIEAGLGWIVKLGKPAFSGKAAIEKVKAEGPSRRLVGLEITGKGIARPGYAVFRGDTPVGKITSGTKGPSVGKAIAMAYIDKPNGKRGTELQVEVRGRRIDAVVVKTPFLVKPAS